MNYFHFRKSSIDVINQTSKVNIISLPSTNNNVLVNEKKKKKPKKKAKRNLITSN